LEARAAIAASIDDTAVRNHGAARADPGGDRFARIRTTKATTPLGFDAVLRGGGGI
jgi:hypothetical protein